MPMQHPTNIIWHLPAISPVAAACSSSMRILRYSMHLTAITPSTHAYCMQSLLTHFAYCVHLLLTHFAYCVHLLLTYFAHCVHLLLTHFAYCVLLLLTHFAYCVHLLLTHLGHANVACFHSSKCVLIRRMGRGGGLSWWSFNSFGRNGEENNCVISTL